MSKLGKNESKENNQVVEVHKGLRQKRVHCVLLILSAITCRVSAQRKKKPYASPDKRGKPMFAAAPIVFSMTVQ